MFCPSCSVRCTRSRRAPWCRSGSASGRRAARACAGRVQAPPSRRPPPRCCTRPPGSPRSPSRQLLESSAFECVFLCIHTVLVVYYTERDTSKLHYIRAHQHMSRDWGSLMLLMSHSERQLCGSSSQSNWCRKRSNEFHPIGGVSACPLFRAPTRVK